ncbi:CPBP family intramembrane glutamic endopeptidase [uncultured Alistipes sp.]|jgi:hypothetical protein|uniref:CPBP family intramembrane glutamic endopeptidase n=1 Tax=uncultured Alistipes sp. TaxID=538949 RepID=UPI0025E8DB73|nr:CPBP family intramembrane glutamic endopeptidase [uncultured Alistipes sp.]
MKSEFISKYWNRYFQYNWQAGLFLILLFGVPRFFLVMQSYVQGSYSSVMFVFLFMWAAPFVLLTKSGRKDIGMKRPVAWRRVGVAFLLGGLACFAVFGVFYLLYGSAIENAFAYIGGNNPGSGVSGDDKLVYFIIAAIPSMLFSPIGEEFLYRGIIHRCFVPRFGELKASFFDSAAFALTHLAHFGIVYVSGAWCFLHVPAILWVLSMFAVCQVFFRCKLYCDSLWGAVVSHAGFNLVMMYCIFYWL